MRDTNRLKETRTHRGIRQIQLAVETGIHPSILSRIECGWIEPTPEQAPLLAQHLGVSQTWLFPDLEKPREECHAV